MDENTRVTLPKALEPLEEAGIEMRRGIHHKVVMEFIDEECDEKGNQIPNLDEEEARGLKKLMKRVKNHDIVIMKTDKSNKFAVTTMEKYIELGKKHVNKDKEIDWDEMAEHEKILNGHSTMWCKMNNAGEDKGHKNRIIESKVSKSKNIAKMYVLYKDHKEDDDTRPVVTGCNSNTRGVVNTVAEFMESVANGVSDPYEVISSEDNLYRIHKANTEVEEWRNKNLRIVKFCHVTCEECADVVRETLSNCGTCNVEFEELKKSASQAGNSEDGKFTSPAGKYDGGKVEDTNVGDCGQQQIVQADVSEIMSEGGGGHRASRRCEDAGMSICDSCFEKLRMEKIEECLKCRYEEQVALVGSDVIALFPSLQERNTGKIVAEEVRLSDLKFEGMNFQMIALYVWINRDLTGDLAGLRRVLPWRRKSGGTEPGMKNIHINSKKEDGIHKQWVFPDVTPTELEKRELLARMSEIAVRAIWKHFVYTFGGKLYLQRSGGPIGARVTMAVARLVMNNMGRKYRLILEAGGLRSFLSSVYVDDSRQKTNNLAKGMRYDVGNNKFEITQEAIEEDNKKLKEGEPISRRMARICQPIMNSVNCDLKFTTEVAEDFGDGRLPTLDFTIEEIHGMMIHSYFEKSMKTPYQVMERSAMSEQQRYSILSNELIRRMSKVHLSIGQEERLSIVEKFIKQLKTSGYSRLQAREAVVSGLVGMKRKMDRKHKLGEEMYRSAASTLKPRLKKKLLEKTSWYKDKRREGDDIGNDDDDRSDMMRKCMGGRVADKKAKQRVSVVKAVMFVPYTHGSRLAKKLREAEMTLEGMTGYRLKIVERGGRRLEDMLHKSDPWEGQLCGRQKCLPCKTKVETGKYSSQSCSKRSAVYETWCVSCEMTGMEEGVDEMTGQHPGIVREKRMAKYIGETARSTYERGFEHLSDLLNTSAKSHMLRHYVESHMGEEFGEMKFQMKVLKFTRTAFERQILESVLIQENRNHNLLNSKSEFNRCSIPRITLKMGESEIPRLDKKAAEELKREEWILSRIRDLRKGNGRKRGNARGNPVRKKIRLDEEHIECKSDKMAMLSQTMRAVV